jgi:hypothetical protein
MHNHDTSCLCTYIELLTLRYDGDRRWYNLISSDDRWSTAWEQKSRVIQAKTPERLLYPHPLCWNSRNARLGPFVMGPNRIPVPVYLMSRVWNSALSAERRRRSLGDSNTWLPASVLVLILRYGICNPDVDHMAFFQYSLESSLCHKIPISSLSLSCTCTCHSYYTIVPLDFNFPLK